MGDLIFILKSFLLTGIVVVLLQVKIGDRTFEERAMIWIQTSSMVRPLHDVASGGVEMIGDIWKSFSGGRASTISGGTPKGLGEAKRYSVGKRL